MTKLKEHNREMCCAVFEVSVESFGEFVFVVVFVFVFPVDFLIAFIITFQDMYGCRVGLAENVT